MQKLPNFGPTLRLGLTQPGQDIKFGPNSASCHAEIIVSASWFRLFVFALVELWLRLGFALVSLGLAVVSESLSVFFFTRL